MPTAPVNYVAIAVAAIVANMAGFLWFSPMLFENRWMRAIEKDPADTAEMQRMKKSIAPLFALVFIGWLLAAYVMAVVLIWSGARSLGDGVRVGFLIWLGFVLPVTTGAVVFSGRPRSVMGTMIGVEASSQLVAFLLMGAILAAWR